MFLNELLLSRRWGRVVVASFDYPGYGDSRLPGVTNTAQVLEYGMVSAKKLFGKKAGEGVKVQRVVWGYSIGTGVAAEVAV